PVTTRVFMHCDGIGHGELRMALRRARCEPIRPEMVFVDGGRPERIEGSLTTADEADLTLHGTIGGALLPSGPFSMETGPQHWAEYEVGLPVGGRWLLWIRARYEDTNSNSFFLRNPEDPEELIRLGNRIGTYDTWLWEGPVRLELEAGTHTLTITGRESQPLQSPILDVIALVHEEFTYTPTDSDARQALMPEQ
ncbi:MAG: hypothetical protein ACP5KN_18765, partial [Armatimonadota bacterium]